MRAIVALISSFLLFSCAQDTTEIGGEKVAPFYNVTSASGSTSPCGGDIAIPAATDTSILIFPCADRLDFNIQLTLSQNVPTSFYRLYTANGANCVPNNTPFLISNQVQSSAANPNPWLTQFCSSNLCCGIITCANPPCGAAVLSIDYTPPSTATCSINRRALAVSPGRLQRFGDDCINVENNYQLTFTLSNSLQQRISVFTAMGDNCETFYNFDLTHSYL